VSEKDWKRAQAGKDSSGDEYTQIECRNSEMLSGIYILYCMQILLPKQ
jgi:hypothetical protein